MDYVCLCIINKLNASDSLKGIISMDVFFGSLKYYSYFCQRNQD